jgi:uncharacterized peroxidase-related enzyme
MVHHGEALRALLREDALADQIREDYTRADLDAPDREMLAYAAKLAGSPSGVTGDDFRALRAAGFDDRAILDIAQITAYFSYVNRLASGLGVQLEDYWPRQEP